MDIGLSFTFVKDDEKWLTKLGIAVLLALFSFLIIPWFFLLGYMVAVARNVLEGEEPTLPEWTDWGKLFSDGAAILAGALVYTVPIWILACLSAVVALPASNLQNNPDLLSVLFGGTALLMTCLMILFWIALIFIVPAILIQYLRTDDFGAIFAFKEVIQIARENIGPIITVMVILFVASLVLGLVAGIIAIIPFCGWILSWLLMAFGSAWLLASAGHLYGQIAGSVKPKL